MDLFGERSAGHFDDRLKLDVFGGPQTSDRCDIAQRRRKQPMQAPETSQKVPAQLYRALASDAGTKEYREQLGFGQRGGPKLQQSLARALVFGPIGDTHTWRLCTVMSGHIKLRHDPGNSTGWTIPLQ
jgi:hypothetical protein